jgi:hypothetical protein
MKSRQKFYISYFGNFRNIPEYIEMAGIVHSMPQWLSSKGYRNIVDLAPTSQILRLWKSHEIDWNTYSYMYVRDVLSQLDFNDILRQLGDTDVCMCCYEVNGEHCHRYLVQKWFGLHGIEVFEVGNKPGIIL